MNSEQPDHDPQSRVLPVAVTVDDSHGRDTPVSGSGASSLSSRGHAAVALVQGTGPQLSGETNALLHRRLRAAALLLAVGLLIALAPHLAHTDFATPSANVVFGFHLAMVFVLAAVAVRLYYRSPGSLLRLRIIELTIFGLPAVFFLVSEYYWTLNCCGQGHFQFFAGRWLLLMYTYALFVPNTWRRAAVVIGAIGLIPLVLLVVMALTDARLASMICAEEWTRMWVVNLIAFAGSVYGVYMIGSLRREAFEARRLGQYRLKQRIGAGGMGEVFLAEHQMMKRACVIKLIRSDRSGDPRSLARFQREVRATAKLSHWNTIDVFDYGSTEDGAFYYVMEYLPGMSLAELVQNHGPLPPARVIHFLRQACDALNEAHGAGLIHRDIKPGNIFAAYRGGVYDVAKLLDFGLVKTSSDDEMSVQLTVDGAITGSPLFMSPEQAMGDGEPDARGDIYSLGAVGYCLLTGLPPFGGDKPIKVMFAHAHEPPVPPSQQGVDVPDDLERVILRCLEKKPADRYQTAAELDAALSACRDAGGWTRADAQAWWEHRDRDSAGC
jgi:serine/threonine-protein kinase